MPPSKVNLPRKTEATARRLNLTVNKPRPASQGVKKRKKTAGRGTAPSALDASEELYDAGSSSRAPLRGEQEESEEAKAAAQLAADKNLVLATINLKLLHHKTLAGAAKPEKTLPSDDGRNVEEELDDIFSTPSNKDRVGINLGVARNEPDSLLTELNPATRGLIDANNRVEFGRPSSTDSRVIHVAESVDENMTGSGSKPSSSNMDAIDSTWNLNDKRKIGDVANIFGSLRNGDAGIFKQNDSTAEPQSATASLNPPGSQSHQEGLDEMLKPTDTLDNTIITPQRKTKARAAKNVKDGAATKSGESSSTGSGKSTEKGTSASGGPTRRRLLTQALKGDWSVVEQILRSNDKAGDVNGADEVSDIRLSELLREIPWHLIVSAE